MIEIYDVCLSKSPCICKKDKICFLAIDKYCSNKKMIKKEKDKKDE